MSEICSILVALAFAILLVLITPMIASRVASLKHLAKWFSAHCDKLCFIRILLGILAGFVAGVFFVLCWDVLRSLATSGPPCLAMLFWILVLSLYAAVMLTLTWIECGFNPPAVKIARTRQLIPFGLIALVVVLILLVARYCGQSVQQLIFASLCGRLVLAMGILIALFIFVRAIELRWCKDPVRPENCKRRLALYPVLLFGLLVLAIWLAWYCKDDLKADFELAMVGIHWDGQYAGEAGAHLRWAFAYELPFPEEGFDLFRRESGSSNWTLLNAEGRIHPVRTWDGAVPGPGTIWLGRGKDRMPPAVFPRFEGTNSENFDFLLDTIQRLPQSVGELHTTMYFVEGRDDPFTNETDALSFVEASGEPLAQWQIEPMTMLSVMALHPEVARLLGLLYIDKTAVPDTHYDYKITGYWSDRDRSYVVEELSLQATQALDPTVLLAADLIPGPTRELPAGGYWPTEAIVGLRWEPPTVQPGVDLIREDGIKSVLHLIEKESRGPVKDAIEPVTGSFELVQEPDDNNQFVPLDPIAVSPMEVEGADDQWPQYFAYDNWVEYNHYDFRVIGVDIFGRHAPPSPPVTVSVEDLVAPPPPVNIEARIYQRNDPEVALLDTSRRDELFPPTSTNDEAIVMSWLWPDALAERVPDAASFQIHYRLSNYDSFSQATSADLWPDTANWEGTLDSPVLLSNTDTLPNRFDPAIPGSVSVPPGSFYETVITDIPTVVRNLIMADDDRPVVYGFMTATTSDVRTNVGKTSGPSIVFTRDLVPPVPPDAPHLLGVLGKLDRQGNTAVEVRIANADLRYTYNMYSVSHRRLSSASTATSVLPSACVADPDFPELQRRVQENERILGQRSATTIGANDAGGGAIVADFTDTADGTISQRFFYAARAIDPAGNVSEFSCPSISVESLDRFPPRAPVVTDALSSEAGVSLTWALNTELDFSRYEIYRTRSKDRINSKRKMALILAANPTGAAIPPTASADSATSIAVAGDSLMMWVDADAKGGTTYHYRLVALDAGGNASEMSEPVSARGVDTHPPSSPLWGAPVALERLANGSVRLHWQADTSEEGLQLLIQRKRGSGAWFPLTGWATPPTTSFDDTSVDQVSEYKYRIRAMDQVGNRSNWSAEASISP